MSSRDFVHLHCHSEFSLLDGANRLSALVEKAAQMEMPALALTDHGVMYGTADFYAICKKAGVKPILGVEAYVAPRSRKQKEPRLDNAAYHMVLLARNNTGYRNLLKLTSIAALEGFYYKPRIDREILERFHEGLIGTSACLGSEINEPLMKGDYNKARDAAAYYRDLLGAENYYIELQNHNLPEQIHCNEQLLKIARELHLPVICSNDVHYLGDQDAEAHDILLCIGTGSVVSDVNRLKYASQEFYLKSSDQMKQIFGEHRGAIENTIGIAERCDVNLEFGRCPMPTPGIPEGYTPHEYLTLLANEGLDKRYNGTPTPRITDRLNYELGIIEKTGFSQYILIVRDFARFAGDKGIFFGVRGSAAGSLTSYLVDITDIDPVEYGLTFERFLNPERVQMPDVDMDFEDTRRAEVIEYVTKKYSPNQHDPEEARVAQIVTFGTLAARAVLNDAGKALGINGGLIDRLTKLVPKIPLHMTIDKTIEAIGEFKAIYESDTEARRLIDLAKRLEGISRHASVHAAGVIISHDPLVDYTPLSRSGDSGCVTQYVASTLEKIGLLKMDFLGLINLSILAQAVKNVEASTGITLDVRKLPLDDEKTYELLGKGDCVGVFQLESPPMRRHIQELKPGNVREVAAMVALYRPGPMAHIPRFIKCKHGQEKIKYPHPWLEELLQETYGVIVYQDQVMQIAQIIAGYTLGEADILRRAMGKKKAEEMALQREKFLSGAAAKGVPENVANHIFDEMEPFAGYAFNKAHAVCYAMVAYQTAFLKANYPVEYMAALLTCFIEKSDKLVVSMNECRRMNIDVLPPDINASKIDFAVEGNAIRFGLAAIKNVGKSTVEGILKVRDQVGGGPFTSLCDFVSRAANSDSSMVSRSTIEALIHAGAFASLNGHQNRRALIQMLDALMVSAGKIQKDRKAGQASLSSMFESDDDEAQPTMPIPEVAEYPRDQILAFERDLLGVYLSDHPLNAFSVVFGRAGSRPVAELPELPDKEPVVLGGIITSIKPFTSKKGDAMAFFTLEDTTGSVACTMFPRTFAQHGSSLVKDRIVLLRGKANHRDRVRDDEEASHIVEILAEEITQLGDGIAPSQTGPSRIIIRVDESKRNMLRYVRDAVEQNRGGSASCPVYLRIQDSDKVHEVRTPLLAEFNDMFRAELEHILGAQAVWTE